MSAVDFMKQTLEFVHRGFRGAAEGLSDDQVHFVPEGESHSIAWIIWHAARIEDLFIQQVFQRQPAEWDGGGWAAKTGLPEKGFGTGQSLEDAKAWIGDMGRSASTWRVAALWPTSSWVA
jgi:hypothetical protein